MNDFIKNNRKTIKITSAVAFTVFAVGTVLFGVDVPQDQIVSAVERGAALLAALGWLGTSAVED